MARKKKVLLVEDDPDITKLTEKILQLTDMECIICNTPKEILEMLKETYEKIIVIIIDIQEPNTIKILREVKNKRRYRKIPIYRVRDMHHYPSFQKKLFSDEEIKFIINNTHNMKEFTTVNIELLAKMRDEEDWKRHEE